MAFVPFPGCAKVELVYSCEGSTFENVLNYQVGPTVEVAELNQLAALMAGIWGQHFRPISGDALELIKVKATSLETESAPGIEYVTGLPLSGQSVTDMLPSNIAVGVIFTTDLRGRSFRGRIYMPGLTEDQTDGSYLTNAQRTAWNTACQELLAPTFEGLETQLAVLSRVSHGVERTVGVQT